MKLVIAEKPSLGVEGKKAVSSLQAKLQQEKI